MKRDYPSEADCKRVGPRLERVVDDLVRYAQRKRFLDPIVDDLRERVPDPSVFPEGWGMSVMDMVGAATVATVPKRAQGFVRSAQSDLAPPELELARQWRRVPWAFVAFDSLEQVEHDIVIVHPVGGPPPAWPHDLSWDQLAVYSRSLSEAGSRGLRSGIALVAYDGTVFHTYGIILLFQSFDDRDLLFFASVAADDSDIDETPFLLGEPEDVSSISAIIRNDPLPFLLLFKWQEIPALTGRRGAWRYCVSMVEYDGAEDLADVSLWQRVVAEGEESIQEIVVIGDVVGLRLGTDTPMYEPLILVSVEDRVIFVRAMTEDAYNRGVAAIASLVTVPDEPQVTASMAMMQAAQEILEPVDLASDLEVIVTEEMDGAPLDRPGARADSDGDMLEDGPDPPDFDAIQPALNLLMESYNEGRDHSDEDIARMTGLDAEQVGMLREKVESMFDRAPGAPGPPGAGSSAKPADRFDLPPGPFHRLMSSPVPAEEGVLALRDLRGAQFSATDRDALLNIPIVRFALWMIGRDEIPATAAGFVTPKLVRQAIEEGIVPVYHNIFQLDLSDEGVPKKEADAPVFHRYREILETAGLIRLDGKRFVLGASVRDIVVPDAGTVEQALDLGSIVSIIAGAMFTRVRWDDTRFDNPVPRLRESAGFLLYVLRRLSAAAPDGWVTIDALYDAFLGAQPQIAEAVMSDRRASDRSDRSVGSGGSAGSLEWWIRLNIRVNFVELFAATLGLVETDHPDIETVRVRPSPLFSILFG